MADTRTVPAATYARDAAYVAIGLGVLGFLKVQVRRRELAQRFPEAHASVQSFLEQQLDSAEALLDQVVDPIVARATGVLPAAAASVVGQVHAASKSARRHARGVLFV